MAYEAPKAVQQDATLATRLGITGTPAFLVGTLDRDSNVRVVSTLTGALPPDRFETAIDDVLRN